MHILLRGKLRGSCTTLRDSLFEASLLQDLLDGFWFPGLLWLWIQGFRFSALPCTSPCSSCLQGPMVRGQREKKSVGICPWSGDDSFMDQKERPWSCRHLPLLWNSQVTGVGEIEAARGGAKWSKIPLSPSLTSAYRSFISYALNQKHRDFRWSSPSVLVQFQVLSHL